MLERGGAEDSACGSPSPNISSTLRTNNSSFNFLKQTTFLCIEMLSNLTKFAFMISNALLQIIMVWVMALNIMT